jgi:hypothetical protein
MSLSRLASKFATEIYSHDWSDCPWRLDRAGHDRRIDSRRTEQTLSDVETDFVRTNVMWVTAQVLRYEDPNFDVHEYAAACGVPRSITHRTNGSRSDIVTYGLRWEDTQNWVPATPGGPMWQVQVQCDVANLVLFKRLLKQVGNPSLPESTVDDAPTEIAGVISTGGSRRIVTVTVLEWDKEAAGRRAVDMVTAALPSEHSGDVVMLLNVQEPRT